MCHRVVRLPPASFFSFFLLLLQDASDSLRTRLRQLRASAGKLALHGAVDPRAGTKLARRGKIETGLGAKQSTAVLGYPVSLGFVARRVLNLGEYKAIKCADS